jgi:Transcription factor WhiB
MSTRSALEFSPGAAGPALRLAPAADPRKATWKDFALCREADPDAWFEVDQRPEAIAICGRCPVQPQCRADAVERGEEHGVWGGVSFDSVADVCSHGHPWDVGNTYRDPDGTRRCRQCRRDRRGYLKEVA